MKCSCQQNNFCIRNVKPDLFIQPKTCITMSNTCTNMNITMSNNDMNENVDETVDEIERTTDMNENVDETVNEIKVITDVTPEKPPEVVGSSSHALGNSQGDLLCINDNRSIEMGLEESCPRETTCFTPNEDDRSSHVFANSQGANLGNNFDSANDFQKNSRQTACLPQSSIPNNSPVNSPSRTAKDINGATSNSGRGGKKKFRRRIGSDPNGSGGGGGIGPNGGE